MSSLFYLPRAHSASNGCPGARDPLCLLAMELEMQVPSLMELAAAFLQAAVTVGLAGLFFFLFRRYRKPYFAWFALAWSLQTFRPWILGLAPAVLGTVLIAGLFDLLYSRVMALGV